MNNQVSATPRRSTPLWILLGGILIVIALAIAAVLLVVLYLVPVRVESSGLPETQPAPAQHAAPAEFAERNGIQVLMLGVTAGGGLIDVRFQVTDAEKAALLLDEAHRPLLIVEGSGAVLIRHIRPEYKVVQEGRIYYLLFANAQNAVSPGDLVSVELGGLRLEPMAVR